MVKAFEVRIENRRTKREQNQVYLSYAEQGGGKDCVAGLSEN